MVSFKSGKAVILIESIIRNGHKVSTIGTFIATKPDETAEPLSPKQIAYFLIDADQKANLEPRICHN